MDSPEADEDGDGYYDDDDGNDGEGEGVVPEGAVLFVREVK